MDPTRRPLCALRVARTLRITVAAVTALATACHRPSPTDAPTATASASLAGTWRDAVGDAPWGWVVFTPRDVNRGHFAALPAVCNAPPCAPTLQGEYELDGDALAVHAPGLEGQRYVVAIGGGTMEWRQNTVAVRRFRFEPAAPPAPHLPTDNPFPAPAPVPAPGTPCDALTLAQCLRAGACVLDHPAPSGGYFCRPAAGPCEGGTPQGDPGYSAACAARPGCRFVPSSCFCPNARTAVAPLPGSPEAAFARVLCACAGGPFQHCVPAP